MKRHRTYLLLSALAIGGVAAYVMTDSSHSRWRRRERTPSASPRSGRSEAYVRARLVDDLPSGATVASSTSGSLSPFPVARAAARRAVDEDARDDWVHVVVEGAGADRVAAAFYRDLPHFVAPDAADGEQDGVYVRHEGELVQLTAAGLALTDTREH